MQPALCLQPTTVQKLSLWCTSGVRPQQDGLHRQGAAQVTRMAIALQSPDTHTLPSLQGTD